jgi:hypothetical protein
VIDNSVLFTIAEIAVALAGFSAIVGVLGSHRDAADLLANSLRLQVMMETCFMIAAAALVPALLDKFGLGSSVIWRAASALFLCVAVPFEVIAWRRTKDMPSMVLTKMNANTINWGMSFSADTMMFAVAINMVGANAEAFFHTALVVDLILAGNLFVQFASDTFSFSDRD